MGIYPGQKTADTPWPVFLPILREGFIPRTLSQNTSSPTHRLSRVCQDVGWSTGARTCDGKDLVHRRPERGCFKEITNGCQRYVRRPGSRITLADLRISEDSLRHTTERSGESISRSTNPVQNSTTPVPPSKSLSMRTLQHTPSTVSDLGCLSMYPSAILPPRSSVRRSSSLSASRLLVYKPWPIQTASLPPRGRVPKPV